MNKYIYEGKTLEEAKNKALTELNLTEENVIINILEEKNGLLKKSVKIELVDINAIIAEIKDTINEIVSLMGLTSNLEVRRRENNITITIPVIKSVINIPKRNELCAFLCIGLTAISIFLLIFDIFHHCINCTT